MLMDIPRYRFRFRFRFVAGMLLAVAALTAGQRVGSASGSPRRFVLASPDPQLSARFPDRYVLNGFGCSGGNESPPLKWSGAPPGTLSFVVTLFDRDEHGTPSGWWHWVVYDIPAGVSELHAAAGAVQSRVLPPAARQGRTDLGTDAYHGPCPDKGDAPHRYVFTLYALDVAALSVPPEPSGAMVVSSLHEHLLGKAELVIRHAR